MIVLKDYQQKALKELLEEFRTHVPPNKILLVAPTGAGKTVLGGSLINELASLHKNLVFIWVSIGKSGLHEQSKYKVDKFFPKLSSLSINDILSTNKQELDSGDILFLNWESISTKSKKFNEWTNIFMRDGENITLPILINNTRVAGKQIILLIDEAHSKGSSQRSKEIIDIINPKTIFNITATPRKKQYDESGGQVVSIKAKDVVAEGVIKKSIVVNKGIRDNNNVIVDLLSTANKRREQLLNLYKQESSQVNPLCLIQVPNGNEGLTIKGEVLNYLRSIGKTEENQKVAVWLTEDKVNLNMLEDTTSPQEFLIFKQAIDTGWDCPRAQILVKYRDIQSEVFKEQILGRILRMPELKHYKHPALNDAYVFTDEQAFSVDKPEEIPDIMEILSETIPLKSEVYDKIMYTVIPSFSYIKINSVLNSRELMIDFVRYIRDHLSFFEKEWQLKRHALQNEIPLDLIYDTVEQSVTTNRSKSVRLTTTLMKSIISKSIYTVIKDEKASSGIIDYLLNKKPDHLSLLEYLEVIVINLPYIMEKLRNLNDKNTISPTVKVSDLPIIYNSVPTSVPVKDTPYENPTFNKLLYMWYPYKTIARQDKIIIDELEEDDTVDWWFYNRTFAYALGIPAIVGPEVTMYKPRFIASRNGCITVIDYTRDEENFKGLTNMLEIWKYKTFIPNLCIDLRYLGRENEQ